MNDSFVVRRSEPLSDLCAVLHRAAHWESTAGQFLPQGVAFEALGN